LGDMVTIREIHDVAFNFTLVLAIVIAALSKKKGSYSKINSLKNMNRGIRLQF